MFLRSFAGLLVGLSFVPSARAGPVDDAIAFVSIRTGDARIYVSSGPGTDRVVTRGTGVHTQPALSADGRLAFTASLDGTPTIYLINGDGSDQRPLNSNRERLETSPSWSPDGKSVAFISRAKSGGDVELRVVDVASGATVVVRGDGREKGPNPPVWSRDGRRLAYIGLDARGRNEVWVVNRDGTGLREVSSKFEARGKADVSISPDGRRVVYVAGLRGPFHIVLADLESGETRNLTEGVNAMHESPRFSPDGRRIVFASTRDDEMLTRSDVFVMDVDGTDVRNLSRHPNEDFNPHWTSDGRRVVFASLRSGTSQLFEVDLSSGQTRRLTNNTSHDMEVALHPARGG